MEVFLRKSGVGDDGHDGDVVLARRFQDEGIRATGDEAVGINGIPGGNEKIDLVSVSEERANGLGLAREVEK